MPTKNGRPKRFGLLSRYVFSELATPFWGSTAFLVFLALMFQTLRWAELLIVHGVSLRVVGRMAGLITLTFLPMALPFSFLVTVLVAFGRLSADSEITAMRACGVGLGRLLVPASWAAGLVALASFLLNSTIAPWAELGMRDLIYKVSNTKVAHAIREGTFTTGFFDLLVFANRVDPKTGQLEHVFLYDEREPSNPFIVTAQRGEILNLQAAGELGASVVLRLSDGSLHRGGLNSQTSGYEKMDFKTYQNFLAIPEGNGFNDWRSGILSQSEIKRQMADPRTEPQQMRELKTEYWRRYHFALSPFVFLVVGVGLGTAHIRRARSSAGLLAFIVLLPYWIILSATTGWAQTGVAPAWLAMSAANAMTLFFGFFALRRSIAR